MKRMKSKWSVLLFTVMTVLAACPTVVLAAEEAPKPAVYATFWALVPPIVAIVLDHERGIQFSFCGNSCGSTVLFRREF